MKISSCVNVAFGVLAVLWKSLITRASVNGKPESENATVFLAKRGVMVPGVSCVDCGNWG